MSDPSRAIGRAICQALDIDPDYVVSLTLSVTVGEWPRLTVEHVAIGEMADLANVLTQYELKVIDERAEEQETT